MSRTYQLTLILLCSFVLNACDNSKPEAEVETKKVVKTETKSEKKTEAKAEMSAADSITIVDPYIRAMPPGQKVTAMFMTMENSSPSLQDLVSADTTASEHAELHEHKMIDGMMKMGQVEKISVEANGSAALKPGGYHIMLIGLKKDLQPGEMVDIKLTFKDGSSKTVKTEVKKIAVN
ncbi:copper chaperone PCu(A)C [Cocleimonas sp. KMM 6892]|uniref:copper chaperone PCu(A)C n=1 Tax=unclassified Cocleimonas TaxID=2639732 RepID=UPI002DBC7DF5|nr:MULTISPECIES: copper chaperone PCu(A)C [unclassified Cocleimonas]MEB8433428.1 copper chaperone PCu(A)C [Cocleimonas sp. KMM 6892]MEC4716239.1 copper chaperone PCu(A)C [Cocleimonas sp. KMM 6895]MEC4745868.1 copper chaperone PCu(A)C [Cocleimonas sp. KMM 6896]